MSERTGDKEKKTEKLMVLYFYSPFVEFHSQPDFIFLFVIILCVKVIHVHSFKTYIEVLGFNAD